jgi:hypothetical protein
MTGNDQHWQHILNYRHQCGQTENLIYVMRHTKKVLLINIKENFFIYIHKYKKISLLVDEQNKDKYILSNIVFAQGNTPTPN